MVSHHPLTTPVAGPEAQCLDPEAEGARARDHEDAIAIRGVNVGKSRPSSGCPTCNLPPAGLSASCPLCRLVLPYKDRRRGARSRGPFPGLGRELLAQMPFSFPRTVDVAPGEGKGVPQ